MKELSFLIFAAAAVILTAALLRNLFRQNPHRNFFFIPETTILNIAWGMLFYAGYGLIISASLPYRILFGCLCLCLSGYLAYLYQIRRFFSGQKSLIPLSHIESKINRQQNFDKQHPTYSARQALRILGLHSSALQEQDTVPNRRTQLLETTQKQNLKHPYFAEMINKACKTLL